MLDFQPAVSGVVSLNVLSDRKIVVWRHGVLSPAARQKEDR
jgi:hypothetical protein